MSQNYALPGGFIDAELTNTTVNREITEERRFVIFTDGDLGDTTNR